MDAVARVGEDEFVVVLSDLSGPHVAARMANEIVEAIGIPIVLGDEEVMVEANMGIAFFPDDAETPEALLQAAATAMHEIETLGVSGFCFAGGGPAPRFRALSPKPKEGQPSRLTLLRDWLRRRLEPTTERLSAACSTS